ncbi:gluconolactonase [Saccharobesus litoralis]|uniref:Gluconolactonase n=2 Tax=Saccharobesus litoralis TaxID=2172099 RepID=A0A2S0VXK3_9ALTE|nr:gluconolactonase [Saccharobesus litoralis]
MTQHEPVTVEHQPIRVINNSVEIYSAEAEQFLSTDTPLQVLSEGYKWTEGPLWVADTSLASQGYLLFSDIPNNKIYQYIPGQGTALYLQPSGATGLVDGDYGQGSNGLLLNQQNQLVLMQQGDRRVAVMQSALSAPQPKFKTLAGYYQGKRLNSPNDAVYDSQGNLYFTDPPYGLAKILQDERKALDFQGVYRLSNQGQLTLLDDEITFPNGIGLSPDGKTLYVAVSDINNPVWYAYDVANNGQVTNKRVFFDAKQPNQKPHGLPDGMAVHSNGTLFATGPDGVWLFNPKGQVIAKVKTGKLTANCTLAENEKALYLSAHDTLMRIPLK